MQASHSQNDSRTNESAGISREEAYIFCSVAGDLRVHEIVDRPNWVVGLMIPQNCFGPVWKKLVDRRTH